MNKQTNKAKEVPHLWELIQQSWEDVSFERFQPVPAAKGGHLIQMLVHKLIPSFLF